MGIHRRTVQWTEDGQLREGRIIGGTERNYMVRRSDNMVVVVPIEGARFAGRRPYTVSSSEETIRQLKQLAKLYSSEAAANAIAVELLHRDRFPEQYIGRDF